MVELGRRTVGMRGGAKKKHFARQDAFGLTQPGVNHLSYPTAIYEYCLDRVIGQTNSFIRVSPVESKTRTHQGRFVLERKLSGRAGSGKMVCEQKLSLRKQKPTAPSNSVFQGTQNKRDLCQTDKDTKSVFDNR